MAHAMRELALQSVIDGVECVDLVVGLKQRVVIHCVKRELAELEALIEQGTADRFRGAAVGIGRIATIRDQLGNQIWIGRISVPLAVNVHALRPYVGNIYNIVARQFPLNI